MHALVVSRHLAIGLTVASNVISLVGFFSGLLLLTALSDREIKTNVLSHPDRASSLFYVLLVMVLLAFSAWGVVWWLRRAPAVVIRGKDTRGSGRRLRAMTTPSPMSASSAASSPESSPRCAAPSHPGPYAGDFAVANSPQGGGDMREDDVGGAVGFAEGAVDITAVGDGRAARVHRLTRGESGKSVGRALTVQPPSPGPSPRPRPRPRRKARGGGLDVLRALFAAFFPVATLVAFVLPSGIGNCVPGLPGYASGGFCECDPRALKASSGVPAYMPGGEVPPNTTIAFVGDSGLRDTADEIYRLMRGEGVSAVVLNGDMDYRADPVGWIARFEAGMGKGMPLFTTVGNHDTRNWVDYQEATLNHWRYVNGSTTTMGMAVATGAGAGTGFGAGAGTGAGMRGSSECRGSVGVKEVCTHQGLGLLLSGAGSGCGGLQETHTAFFTETLDEFARNKVRWPLCIFHQNVKAMQLGSKGDVVGWDKYDACLKRGAMIITAHDHTYVLVCTSFGRTSLYVYNIQCTGTAVNATHICTEK